LPEILLWHWLTFAALVALLLALDLLVFHRRDRVSSLREALGWTAFWCSLAAAFNVLLWWWRGSQPGIEFLTGYVLEWSLSMDNVFVFAVIFRYFRVPQQYQYRVLFWGILGAIILRLLFILAGTELIRRFHWVLPLFGLLLIYAALKLLLQGDALVQPEKSFVLRGARRLLRVTRGDHLRHGRKFFAREDGRRCITPLFLVLLVVESTDVLFALDSVPAIFGITRDPFIVFTSNIFAILGLRALYFLLVGAIEMFRYLGHGLSAVLAFIGLSMMAEYFLGQEGEHLIPTGAKLLVIAAILVVAIVASTLARRREKLDHRRQSPEGDQSGTIQDQGSVQDDASRFDAGRLGS
jgi:tellurite resistance protein TerC